MKVCLCFFVLWIKRHLGGFEYQTSFKFLSFSLSLWVILSSFPSSCSVTTWQSFDFYMHAAQTPTVEHVRVLSLSPIPRFHPVDEFTADAGALQSVHSLFRVGWWPFVTLINPRQLAVHGGMLLQTSPLWSTADIMTPSPLPPNREHYNVNTVKILWTNVPYHVNSIW